MAQLETPSRIVSVATGQLQMVRPASVVELPYVSSPCPSHPNGDARTRCTRADNILRSGCGRTGGDGHPPSGSTTASTTTPTSTP